MNDEEILEESAESEEYTPEFEIPTPEPEPEPQPVTFTQEQVQAMIEQERQRVQPVPNQPVQTTLNPMQEAKQRAEAEGWDWDTEKVTATAMEIASERAYQRAMNDIGGIVRDPYIETTTRNLVGDDPIKQQFAKEWVAQGVDVTNPKVRELINLAADSYAAKKKPASIRVESGTVIPQVHSQDRAEVAIWDNILRSVNPKAGISDDDIKAVKSA